MASAFKAACDALVKLPGVGRRSAERLVFYLLAHKKEQQELIAALGRVGMEMKPCHLCGLISDRSPCRICSSVKRHRDIICVVKTAHDAFRIERSGGFNGLYHVLGGLISPFTEVYEQELTIAALCERVRGKRCELFIAFEESLEGDATIKLLQERLNHEENIKFTRMAVGIPLGAGIEHVDSETLKLSLAQRKTVAGK